MPSEIGLRPDISQHPGFWHALKIMEAKGFMAFFVYLMRQAPGNCWNAFKGTSRATPLLRLNWSCRGT